MKETERERIIDALPHDSGKKEISSNRVTDGSHSFIMYRCLDFNFFLI